MKERFDTVIVHYNEIGLKGLNRPFFERKLVDNIRYFLDKSEYTEIKRLFGRILIKLDKKSDREKIRDKIEKVFGISNFSFGYEVEKDMDKISELIVKKLKAKAFETFRIDSKRSDKSFKHTSQDMNKILGDAVRKRLKKKVKLKDPDISVFVEVVDKQALVFFDKIPGLDGLPVGVSGKVLCLMSSGIDSPVAAYKMMSRGLHVDFVHFHSRPKTSKKSIDKTIRLVKLLNRYQKNSKLYLVPFLDIQKAIVLNTLESYRIILYRRMMLKVAGSIAKKEKARALVTGESVGQVASQTLENLNVTSNASGMLILRPLIGEDKSSIIKLAKKIGTYGISIEPHDDCCTLFIPKHPETRADLERVEGMEKFFKKEDLIKNAIKCMEIKEI